MAQPEISLYDKELRLFRTVETSAGPMLTRWRLADAALGLSAITRDIEKFAGAYHIDTVESHPEYQEIEQQTRAFVERTIGASPQGDVVWREDNEGIRHSGAYVPAWSTTYMIERTYENAAFDRMTRASVLVHEITHSTGNPQALMALQNDPENLNPDEISFAFPYSDMPAHISRNKGERTINLVGSFFEEGFAEETAARWNEEFLQKNNVDIDPHALSDDGRLILPNRFFTFDYTGYTGGDLKKYPRHYAVAAFAAYTLSQLSEASGTDLYGLQCQIRRGEDAAAAKRQFIAAIESVGPGLYRRLRRLEYTERDFRNGRFIVRDALRYGYRGR